MSSKKGFTLIELMIVIAIIAIIAAIAIPNLMQSRIRANEATAVTAIKNYCAAQVQFQVGKQGRYSANTSYASSATSYCVTYPNLFYGNPVAGMATGTGGTGAAGDLTKNLALISRAHADAYITLDGGTINSTPTTPGGQTPYQGYQFQNPNGAPSNFFQSNFAQVAAPSMSGTTGQSIYWVGIEGTVYMQGVGSGESAATTGAVTTPSKDGKYDNWLSL